MNLYAVCWQDSTEPWGWDPIEFFWKRPQANKALELRIQSSTRAEMLNRGWEPIPEEQLKEEAEARARKEFSIQRYEVPDPPERIRLT